jgi:ferredoxin-type protein NapG
MPRRTFAYPPVAGIRVFAEYRSDTGVNDQRKSPSEQTRSSRVECFKPMSDDKPIQRRHFFREGLRSLIDNIGKAAEPMQRAMGEFDPKSRTDGGRTAPVETGGYTGGYAADDTAAKSPRFVNALRILRPPGAKEIDDDFIGTCSRCQNCVSACPVHAIQIDDDHGDGVPYIIAEQQPCVMCDGLLCMYNCPSGAITALPIGLVDMGTAEWREGRCIRSEGTDCTMCIDRCPIGGRAIELLDGKVVVHEEGCTGCGVCEHDCPTSPKSIVVIPRAVRDS